MNPSTSPMLRRDGQARSAPGPVPAVTAAIFVVLACVLATGCGKAVAHAQAPRVHPAASPAAATAALLPGQAAAVAGSGGTGMAMLEKAAAAAASTPFQGVELISAQGAGGEGITVADVWHRSDGGTITKTSEAGTSDDSQPYVSADTSAQAPEGVLGVTKKLVSLLGAHYRIVYGGPGSADSRPAQIVGAWRASGGLAARFWLDTATGLPLRREVFDSRSRLVSEDVLIGLRLGSPAMASGAAGSRGPWSDSLTRAQLSQLRTRGWTVPAALPGGLSLFDADEGTMSTGRVLDLGYSDGLSVISVFVQRGTLPPRLPGWHEITLDGWDVYAKQPDPRSLTWADGGFVYTVMAEAPPADVNAAVGVLPHNASPGFWQRLSRGFGRLASWANPIRR